MALTNEQYLMHVGACLQRYLQVELSSDGIIDAQGVKKAAVSYFQHGIIGTAAERKEAMQTLLRRVYKKITGRDVDNTDHDYMAHWLVEGVAAMNLEV